MHESVKRAIRRQLMFWLGTLALFLFFLWLFSDILLPFVAGMALAYFLDPVADMLERWGVSRLVATVIILFVFLIAFVVGLMIVVPVLGSQITGFLQRLPDLVTRLQSLITSTESDWLRQVIGMEGKSLQDNIGELTRQGAGWLATLMQKLWDSGKAIVSIASLLIITPVVAFYLLYDWDHMVKAVDGWLPRDHRDTIHELLRDINTAVAGFVRGQGTLCIILGLFYAIALTLAGLNFGLLIGLFAGLISFIPYVGSLTGFVLSVGVALVQFWPDWPPIAIVVAIFAVGQFLEGNILQPRLVGRSVGLHPVWLMFALFAFGSLFGFTGMLVAVPVSAAIGVVVRFALSRYLASELYTGHAPALAAPSGDEPRGAGQGRRRQRPRRQDRNVPTR
ncbi:MAG: AI-2E family transporter [Alphaproteobacteria bacterium]|nr:MAG: AI-2E family transporter [Alphaproteobacteria bacterium]